MSYVVLARKWRPMAFEDLVGQEHVATTLCNAINIDRVAHAFLFTGARGVGKTTSARILAKALNCEKGPTPKPCLVCPACKEIAAGQDMDVQEIDAASRTGVDDIRDLQETLVYRPARDRFKIFIVDEVHMLSSSAWNAFLKTLEEPPPHVKFIFATTEVNKVPVTILSRCQRYDFKLISTPTITARLEHVLGSEKIQAEPSAVQLIAREAAGSMRDAMSLLDQAIAGAGGVEGTQTLTGAKVASALGVAESTALYRVAKSAVERDAPSTLDLAAKLGDAGYDMEHVTRDFLGILRDLVVARVAPDARSLLTVPDGELAELKQISELTSVDDLTRMHLSFSKASEEILKSPLPRASFEMAVVRLSTRPPLVPIDELVRRLVELEARLSSGSAPAGPAGSGGTRARPRPSEPSDDPGPPAPPPSADTAASPEPEPSPTAPAPSPAPIAGPSSAPPPPPSAPPASLAAFSERLPIPVTPESDFSSFMPRPLPSRPTPPPPAATPPPAFSPPPLSPTPVRPASTHPVITDVRHPGFAVLAELAECLRGKSARISSLFERAALIDATPEKITVGIEARSFEAGLLGEPSTRAVLTSAGTEVFGPAMEIDVIDIEIPANAPTLAKLVGEVVKSRRAEAERSIRTHPLVVAALDELRAEIRDVRLPPEVESAPVTLRDATRPPT